MFIIKIPMHSERKDVERFLTDLKELISSKTFDCKRDLILVRKRKEEAVFSADYTLHDLEYDSGDVLRNLYDLQPEEYAETLVDNLIDDEDGDPPLLFVFGRDINGRQVYIKLKIKGEARRRVLCLSFHYAKYRMRFPYGKRR